MNFGEAVQHLRQNNLDGSRAVTRSTWYGAESRPVVKLQVPDEHSKMTMPYLYMEKYVVDHDQRDPNSLTGDNHDCHKLVRFPLDFSCESILAEDWKVVV